jgi:branched-chain amino acid transport system substrate-binding protein
MSERRAKYATIVAIAALIAGGGAGCTHKPTPIRIGTVGLYSTSNVAQDVLRGVQMAIEEANHAGGIAGRPIELVVAQDTGLGELAVRIARGFVADKDMIAVVGHMTSAAMLAAAPVYDGQMAAVSTMATSPYLTGISRWVYRVPPSDSGLAEYEARLFAERGWRRLAVLYENDEYGRALADRVVRAHRIRGGEVTNRDAVMDGTTDFDVFLRLYAKSRPDVVLVITTYLSAKAFVDAAAAHHLGARIVGADGWGRSLILDPAAEGIMWPSVYFPTDTLPVATRFRKDFTAHFGREPDAIPALGYDATLVVLDAIRRGGASRTAVQRALDDPGFVTSGATGPIRFHRGDRVGSVGGLLRVSRGEVAVEARWTR